MSMNKIQIQKERKQKVSHNVVNVLFPLCMQFFPLSDMQKSLILSLIGFHLARYSLTLL